MYLQTLLETKESGHDLNEGNPFEIKFKDSQHPQKTDDLVNPFAQIPNDYNLTDAQNKHAYDAFEAIKSGQYEMAWSFIKKMV